MGVNVLDQLWKQVGAGIVLLLAVGQLLHFMLWQKQDRDRERREGR